MAFKKGQKTTKKRRTAKGAQAIRLIAR